MTFGNKTLEDVHNNKRLIKLVKRLLKESELEKYFFKDTNVPPKFNFNSAYNSFELFNQAVIITLNQLDRDTSKTANLFDYDDVDFYYLDQWVSVEEFDDFIPKFAQFLELIGKEFNVKNTLEFIEEVSSIFRFYQEAYQILKKTDDKILFSFQDNVFHFKDPVSYSISLSVKTKEQKTLEIKSFGGNVYEVLGSYSELINWFRKDEYLSILKTAELHSLLEEDTVLKSENTYIRFFEIFPKANSTVDNFYNTEIFSNLITAIEQKFSDNALNILLPSKLVVTQLTNPPTGFFSYNDVYFVYDESSDNLLTSESLPELIKSYKKLTYKNFTRLVKTFKQTNNKGGF